MIHINLIPARQGKKRELGRQQLVLFGLVLAIGGVANYLWIGHEQDDVDARRQTVAKIQKEIAALDAAIGEVNSITKEKKDLEDKLQVLDTLKKKRVGPVKVMDSLAQVVPAHVWLTSMEEKGGAVALDGLGMTNDDVAEFMRELKRSPYFKNIVLKKVQTQETTGAISQVVQFQITCSVSYSA
jgi:type IV pilus assembly protein PilN